MPVSPRLMKRRTVDSRKSIFEKDEKLSSPKFTRPSFLPSYSLSLSTALSSASIVFEGNACFSSQERRTKAHEQCGSN